MGRRTIQKPCKTCKYCKYSKRKKYYYCWWWPGYKCDFLTNEKFPYEKYCPDYERIEVAKDRLSILRRRRRIQRLLRRLK